MLIKCVIGGMQMDEMNKYVQHDLLRKFEFQSYGHALEILNEAYPEQCYLR